MPPHQHRRSGHKLWKWLIDNFISALGVPQETHNKTHNESSRHKIRSAGSDYYDMMSMWMAMMMVTVTVRGTLQRRLSARNNVPLNDIMNCIIYAAHCADAPTTASATNCNNSCRPGARGCWKLLFHACAPGLCLSLCHCHWFCACDNKTADILPYDVTTAATTNSCNLQRSQRQRRRRRRHAPALEM